MTYNYCIHCQTNTNHGFVRTIHELSIWISEALTRASSLVGPRMTCARITYDTQFVTCVYALYTREALSDAR